MTTPNPDHALFGVRFDPETGELAPINTSRRPAPEPQPATDPREVTVATIMQMARAFPGMAPDAASRLLHEADHAYCQGPSAADTLGVFLAEVRRPITGVLEAGARYRVIKIKHRVYRVTPEAVEE